jgi:hypothetical protein
VQLALLLQPVNLDTLLSVQFVNNVTTVQHVVLTIVVQTGPRQNLENLSLVVTQEPKVMVHAHLDQLVMIVHLVEMTDQTEHLAESGLLSVQHVMIEPLVVSGLQSVQLVMIVPLVESGLQSAQHVMTEHLVVMTELQEEMIVHHVMIVLLVESGLLSVLLVVMTELLVVNGLQSVQPVMIEHLVESGLKRDRLEAIVLLVVISVTVILVDLIVLLETITVREVLMVQERSLQTRRLSLKMLF